ncbi:MAG: SH3 domain-containing protein [Rhodovibrionaceae bacterium]
MHAPPLRALLLLTLLLPAAWLAGPLAAQDVTNNNRQLERQVDRPGQTGLPLPRFVSLRASEVNLRAGPGIRYPIQWVYQRRNMPVEVIEEFETWRRIRDWEGTDGWVHQSMIQGRRSILVTGQERLLLREPEGGSAPVAKLEAGVVGELLGCNGRWCEVAAGGFDGWLPREAFYGTYPDETLE